MLICPVPKWTLARILDVIISPEYAIQCTRSGHQCVSPTACICMPSPP